MHRRVGPLSGDRPCEIGEYADRRGKRIGRIGLGQAVDLRDEFLDRSDRVRGMERREVHQGETGLQALRRGKLIQAGSDQFQTPSDLFVVRGIPVFFKQVIHIFGY